MESKRLSFREFIKLPAAKQVVYIGLVVIAGLVSVILYQEAGKRGLISDNNTLRVENGNLKQSCGEEKLVMAQKYEREKNDMLQQALNYANTRLAVKEKALDEALAEANKVIATQNRTSNNVRRITKQVSKIVQK